MKKCIALLVAVLLLLSGCAAPVEETLPTTTAAPTTLPTETTVPAKTRDQMVIYISLPSEADPKWSAAGAALQQQLEELTYQVILEYAAGDAWEQSQQLMAALEQGVDCAIVAAVDAAAMMDAAFLAEELQIPIISYDRLLMDTNATKFYVSYDYTAMGVALGRHIAGEKGLDALTEGQSVTIEFFMGSPEDTSALLMYQGIMQVLEPYLESGVLVSKTGRVAFEDTCVVDWDPEAVKTSLSGYLKESYRRSMPDVICTVSDDFAAACIQVLEEKKLTPLPLITGIGGTVGIENIRAGKQTITLVTDMTLLNGETVTLVDTLLMGEEPVVNNPDGISNNAREVPAQLCDFAIYTAENLPEPEPEPRSTTAPTETTAPQ